MLCLTVLQNFGQDIALEPDAAAEPAIVGATNNTFLKHAIFSMEYTISFPMGDFNDYISTVGARGFNFELKQVLNDRWSVGGSAGWYAFKEHYDRSTYEFDQGALTTEIWNYFYSIPLKAVGHFYLAPSSFVQPFIGMSLGVTYNEMESDIGFLNVLETSWDFTFTPEVGVIVPFGSGAEWGGMLKCRYNHIVYNHNDFSAIQHIDLTFGLVYSY